MSGADRPRTAARTSGVMNRRKPRNQKCRASAVAVARSRCSTGVHCTVSPSCHDRMACTFNSFVVSCGHSEECNYMMRSRYLSTVALGVVLTLTLSGCHKKVAPAAPPPPLQAASPAPPLPPPPPPPPAAAPAPPALTEEQIFRRQTLDQLNGDRPLFDVYFDYNMSE